MFSSGCREDLSFSSKVKGNPVREGALLIPGGKVCPVEGTTSGKDPREECAQTNQGAAGVEARSP